MEEGSLPLGARCSQGGSSMYRNYFREGVGDQSGPPPSDRLGAAGAWAEVLLHLVGQGEPRGPWHAILFSPVLLSIFHRENT